MKPYETDEELDRALFALELEEPPADLRSSILAATIYRAPVPLNPWEVWILGAFCALLAWIAVLFIHGGSVPAFATLKTYVVLALTEFARPDFLFWTALGGGLVLWISQLNLTPVAGALRASRR